MVTILQLNQDLIWQQTYSYFKTDVFKVLPWAYWHVWTRKFSTISKSLAEIAQRLINHWCIRAGGGSVLRPLRQQEPIAMRNQGSYPNFSQSMTRTIQYQWLSWPLGFLASPTTIHDNHTHKLFFQKGQLHRQLIKTVFVFINSKKFLNYDEIASNVYNF